MSVRTYFSEKSMKTFRGQIWVAKIFQDCRETSLRVMKTGAINQYCVFCHTFRRTWLTMKKDWQRSKDLRKRNQRQLCCVPFWCSTCTRPCGIAIATWASCTVNVQQTQLTDVVLRDDGHQRSSWGFVRERWQNILHCFPCFLLTNQNKTQID